MLIWVKGLAISQVSRIFVYPVLNESLVSMSAQCLGDSTPLYYIGSEKYPLAKGLGDSFVLC